MRALALAFLAAALPALAQESALQLRLPSEDKVAFRGIASFDNTSGAPATPMYPVPGLAGALVALLTHGVIVDSTRRVREDSIQKTADNVLAPHREALDKLSYREILQGASARMTAQGEKRVVDAGAKPVAGLVIDSEPVFAMTQDAQSIMLDNPIAVRRPDDAEGKYFAVVVRVVSTPHDAAPWSADNGKLLKEKLASLLAESFDMALGAMARQASADAPQRTVRYRLGKDEHIERAQVLAERCDRLILRNLRGWLLSVPVVCEKAPAEPAGSEPARSGRASDMK